ncbi:MAG TPA: nuclear transport factor 2 family protein [Pyrinomonadaceae bacterium]
MKKNLIPLMLFFLLASVAPAQKANLSGELRSLVETERAFAKSAAEHGTRTAFLSFIADDGTLFRPHAVNGRKWLLDHPVPASQKKPLLSWQPIFADISQAGDMGYTTGPWEFRQDAADEKPVAYGNFVTVWKKQPDGHWKFVIDLGISNPAPTSAAVAWQPKAYSGKGAWRAGKRVEVEAERATLIEREREFSRSAAAQGFAGAFSSFAAADIRLYREGAFPFIGREAAMSSLASSPGVLSWQPVKSDVARSGDLGYAYGTYELKAVDAKSTGESGNYMRIWKKQRDGTWRVVLEVLNPLPPATKN